MTNEDVRKVLNKIVRELDDFMRSQTRMSVSMITRVTIIKGLALEALKRIDDEKAKEK